MGTSCGCWSATNKAEAQSSAASILSHKAKTLRCWARGIKRSCPPHPRHGLSSRRNPYLPPQNIRQRSTASWRNSSLFLWKRQENLLAHNPTLIQSRGLLLLGKRKKIRSCPSLSKDIIHISSVTRRKTRDTEKALLLKSRHTGST